MITPKPATVFDLFNGHPERWTKDANARNGIGHRVEPDSDDATCFCVIGAIDFVYGTIGEKDAGYEKLRSIIGNAKLLLVFNDAPSTTFETMLAKVKEAGI